MMPELSFCHHGGSDPNIKELISLSGELTDIQNNGRYFASDHALIGGDFIL